MLRRSTRLIERAVQHEAFIKAMCKSISSSSKVQLDKTSKQFFIKMGDDKATIDYENIDANTLDLHHTSVPEVFQGKGIGKILAKGTFDYCVENNLKMKLSCEYLQKFYQDNKSNYKIYVLQ